MAAHDPNICSFCSGGLPTGGTLIAGDGALICSNCVSEFHTLNADQSKIVWRDIETGGDE